VLRGYNRYGLAFQLWETAIEPVYITAHIIASSDVGSEYVSRLGGLNGKAKRGTISAITNTTIGYGAE